MPMTGIELATVGTDSSLNSVGEFVAVLATCRSDVEQGSVRVSIQFIKRLRFLHISTAKPQLYVGGQMILCPHFERLSFRLKNALLKSA
jgi:hypothetical protein